MIHNSWLDKANSKNLLTYVGRVRDRLWQATELARKHMSHDQSKIKSVFDKKAKNREYIPGDTVLLYLPIKRGEKMFLF